VWFIVCRGVSPNPVPRSGAWCALVLGSSFTACVHTVDVIENRKPVVAQNCNQEGGGRGQDCGSECAPFDQGRFIG